MDFVHVSASKAQSWSDGLRGRDFRPKLVDGSIQYLLDSGSMTSVVCPVEGDEVDHTISLKAVDGKRFDCYGTREISVQIGRKTYSIQAVIAKVKNPILGWDFFKKYRLDLVWGEFGDLMLRDKKANISKVLDCVTIPHKSSPRFSELVRLSQDGSLEWQKFSHACVDSLGAETKTKPRHAHKYQLDRK